MYFSLGSAKQNLRNLKRDAQNAIVPDHGKWGHPPKRRDESSLSEWLYDQ
jgi:hypothetical protein